MLFKILWDIEGGKKAGKAGTQHSKPASTTRSWRDKVMVLVSIPEGVGAESRLVIAGHSAGSLVSRHHVLQWGLLDHVETDTQTGSTLHVIDVLWLEDSVHCQALQIQLNTRWKKNTPLTHKIQNASKIQKRWSEFPSVSVLGTCGVTPLSVNLYRSFVITVHDKTTVICFFPSQVRPGGGRKPQQVVVLP